MQGEKEKDLQLKLFSGLPLYADNFGYIHPLTVENVVHYGYSDYLMCLNLMNLNKEDIFSNPEEIDEEQMQKVNLFNYLVVKGGQDVVDQLERALSLFLHGEATIDHDDVCAYIEKQDVIYVVNGDNFEEIQEIIRYQNYIKFFEEKSQEAPMDEKTRKFKERQEKLQKKRDQIKKKQEEKKGSDDEEEGLDFYDIISSIASKSYSVNELSVMNLTIYQVYSKFKRLDVIDQYDISIKSMLAGAKDIKLKHWSTKLD